MPPLRVQPILSPNHVSDDEPQDYTSLKRSLSRLAEPPNGHASQEHTKAKNPKSAKPLQIDLPHVPMATEVAFAAMQYLPIPLLVLSSLKTVLLANEAMGRLLGIRKDHAGDDTVSGIDVLKGQTLSQIGVDMMQDGKLTIMCRSCQVRELTQDRPTCMGELGEVPRQSSRTP